MAIDLLSCFIKHERRVRLLFSVDLAAGAFTSIAPYAVQNIDGRATSPSVVAVFAVAHAPNVVEIQLGSDLTPGAAYHFAAVGVPGVDGSLTLATSSTDGTFGEPTVTPDAGQGVSALAALLYGKDLRWSGSDFIED